MAQVYLHVDLTYYPAVRMYEMMGYELVNDLEVSFEVRAAFARHFSTAFAFDVELVRLSLGSHVSPPAWSMALCTPCS